MALVDAADRRQSCEDCSGLPPRFQLRSLCRMATTFSAKTPKWLSGSELATPLYTQCLQVASPPARPLLLFITNVKNARTVWAGSLAASARFAQICPWQLTGGDLHQRQRAHAEKIHFPQDVDPSRKLTHDGDPVCAFVSWISRMHSGGGHDPRIPRPPAGCKSCSKHPHLETEEKSSRMTRRSSKAPWPHSTRERCGHDRQHAVLVSRQAGFRHPEGAAVVMTGSGPDRDPGQAAEGEPSAEDCTIHLIDVKAGRAHAREQPC